MRLTINGEQVSYSLENERTLGEVVSGVQQWLAAAGFLVTGMRWDARDLLQAPPGEWDGAAVGGVGELAITATRTADMKIEHWRTIRTWLGMLGEELRRLEAEPATGEDGPLRALLQDLPQTIESIRANPFLPRGSEIVDRFESLFNGNARNTAPATPPGAEGAAAVRSWPPGRLHEGTLMIESLGAQVERRIDDATRPLEALPRCAAGLRGSLAKLPEVSVLLQTGRDKAAMEIVVGFADVVQSIMDLLPFLPPDPERARLMSELNPVLRDLVAAFDARDSVLIGDLLEYEIAPRMERIAPLLEGAA